MDDDDRPAPVAWTFTLIAIATAVVAWSCDHFLPDWGGMYWIGIPALAMALHSVWRADWR